MSRVEWGCRYIVVFVLLVCGCTLPVRANCQWEEFNQLNFNERQESLLTCAPSEQVDLYLKWSFATVPANYELVEALASQGEQVAPIIVARIGDAREPKDQVAIPELLFVLDRMKERGYYDITRDKNAMGRLESAVANVSLIELKSSAEQTLGWLRGQEQKAK